MRSVLAYLDPGSGSLFVQLIVGGLAGIATVLVTMRRRLASLFRFKSRAAKASEAREETPS